MYVLGHDGSSIPILRRRVFPEQFLTIPRISETIQRNHPRVYITESWKDEELTLS